MDDLAVACRGEVPPRATVDVAEGFKAFQVAVANCQGPARFGRDATDGCPAFTFVERPECREHFTLRQRQRGPGRGHGTRTPSTSPVAASIAAAARFALCFDAKDSPEVATTRPLRMIRHR